MANLLDLVDSSNNCGLKIVKSLALNVVFIRVLEIFLKDQSNNLDTIIRHLDNYLSDVEDLGVLTGIINK